MKPQMEGGHCQVAKLLATAGSVLAVSWIAKTFIQRKRFDRKVKSRQERIRTDKFLLEERLMSEGEDKLELWKSLRVRAGDEILSGLRKGDIKAIDALKAFTLAAIEVDRELNCVTEFISGAEERAKHLDALPTEQRGPLHGLPICVKDNFRVKGSVVTNGMSMFMDDKCSDNSVAVKVMLELGAVPYCLTNVPQTCMSHQCSNPLFGATGNPHKPEKEAGGSSGGTASLIGGGGAMLGLGNDIGGSLRNPAAMCGVYSLKPTHGRHLSCVGLQDPLTPIPSLPVVSGFMAESVTFLAEAYKSLWNCQKALDLDISVLPIKWNEEEYSSEKKLKIGFCPKTSDFAPTHPGCMRAVLEAKEILEGQGHQLVEYQPPCDLKVLDLYMNTLGPGASKFLEVVNQEEVIDSSIRMSTIFFRAIKYTPIWARKWLLNPLLGLVSNTYLPIVNDVPGVREVAFEANKFHQAYVDKMIEDGVDLLLTPACIIPAPDQGFFGDFAQVLVSYAVANILNLPAGIAPITAVTEEDQSQFNDSVHGLEGRMVKAACQNSEGLPLAVQVIGRRYQEEKVLRILGDLEKGSQYGLAKRVCDVKNRIGAEESFETVA